MSKPLRAFAVALHDVEPATFERCAEIRQWLCERGIERMTLLVIPARDLHPLGERSPEVVHWLAERRCAGDAIAQHGFQHAQPLGSLNARGRAVGMGSLRETEFVGLDAEETCRAVDAGRRVLKLAGIEPHGFVAPGYAYTPALRGALAQRFQWWTELFGVRRVASQANPGPRLHVPPNGVRPPEPLHRPLPPPLAPASPDRLHRALARALAHVEALAPNATVRLDVHPDDFDRSAGMRALERALLRLNAKRRSITYEELALAEPIAESSASLGRLIHIRRRPSRPHVFQPHT